LNFYWRLLLGGETANSSRAAATLRAATSLPDVPAQTEFCRLAEDLGLTGLLVDIGAGKPDPIVLSTALGLATRNLEFLIACRSGLQSPAVFVQQINTISALIDGRVSLNVVAGHSPLEQRYYGDFLDHEQRYERTAEFLAICHAFWRRDRPVNFAGRHYTVENGVLGSTFISPTRQSPELFIAGGSPAACDLAIRHGDCWMRLPDTPTALAEASRPVLKSGKSVGLRLSMIGAATRREALEIAHTLLATIDRDAPERTLEGNFIARSDSVSFAHIYRTAGSTAWLTPTLWTGLVRSHGAPAIALVGDADEIAAALIDFKHVGISKFILSGWPKADSMKFFGEHVLPRVRRLEHRTAAE
jgi:alkanesulfonate monooxygenase